MRQRDWKTTLCPAGAGAVPAAPRLSGKERFEKEKRLTVIERKLDKLEERIDEVVARMHETARDWARAAELGREVDALRAEKDALEEEWLAISAALAD